MADPKIQVLVTTHPDYGTETVVYVDGKRVAAEIESIDPGAGYTDAEFQERLKDARKAAKRKRASEFDADLAQVLFDHRDQFQKWATD